MKKPKGLGRGLEALLGTESSPLNENLDAPSSLAVRQLRAGKYQPRTRMDEASLSELADSIKSQGLMQPILVRPISIKDNAKHHASGAAQQYEIIAGERRFRAAQMAGLDSVPVLVKNVPDEAAAVMALIENIQREDLNALEEARGVERLLSEFKLTHEQAAQAIGRSRSATSNLLRLLNLARPVQDMLMAGDLDMGHARALLVVDAATQINLANQIVAKRLSVREAEKLANAHHAQIATQTDAVSVSKIGTKNKTVNRDVARLEEQLSDALASTVKIKSNPKGRGQVLIEFSNWEVLEGIVGRLQQVRS